MNLFTKYRPKSWGDLIGHSRLKLSVKRMLASGTLGGRAFLISGESGIGKSTSAYLIAQDVCDKENIIEVNATVVTRKMVREWHKRSRQLVIGHKTGRAIVINEIHKLRTDVITLLLEILEDIPDHMVWVFTGPIRQNQMGLFNDEDSGALESRCVPFRLDGSKYRIHFAKFAMRVAEMEGLGGADFERYLQMVDDVDCNLRATLSKIEAGEMMPDDDEMEAELLELAGV